MMRVTAARFIFVCLLFPAIVHAARGDNLVHASLQADVSTIAPGQAFRLGILLKIDPEYHIYWKNPGDSGLATMIKLQLPSGFTAGPIQYPYPTRIVLPGDIVNYSYETETMLIATVTAPANLDFGTPLPISAKVNWLVCKESCYPGSAVANLQLTTASTTASANIDLFEKWTARIPQSHDPDHISGISASTDLKPSPTGMAGSASIQIHWKAAPAAIQWFPAQSPNAILSNINISTEKMTTSITYHVDISPDAPKFPGVNSVLVYTIPNGRRLALAIPAGGN